MGTMATTSLREPTSEDVRIFGEYMNHRSGSVLTRNEDDLERYNTDWTVSCFFADTFVRSYFFKHTHSTTHPTIILLCIS